jgi:hypothetical protein
VNTAALVVLGAGLSQRPLIRRAKERGELVRRRRALLSGCLATEKQRDSVA